LVEDDTLLGDALQVGLRGAGFVVDWVTDGVAAETALAGEEFAAVVLDLGLPRLAGLELLRRLRGRGNRTPVVVLTARDAVEDRVRGLDLGADDYVAKPVSLAELAARLRAVTRRAMGVASGVLTLGSLSIDPAARTVVFRGAPVDLQAREFALLYALASRAGRVLTRSQLEARLYEWDRGLDSNAIDVYVHHLRRKLSPELIRTVRGVGYVIPRDA
ncbi:MAG: response regulator transcription factor, partial [Steroidobacteraceae bacterium]|nr:response regulator transcription factor [Steroidobacteraceae bacterium]